MIKILLDDTVKQEIIDMHWKDATKAPTGLNNVLQDRKIQSLLKRKYMKIYSFFMMLKENLIKLKLRVYCWQIK